MKPTALALSAFALLSSPVLGQQAEPQVYTFRLNLPAGTADLQAALEGLGLDTDVLTASASQFVDDSGSFTGQGINVFQVQADPQEGEAPAAERGYLGIGYEPVEGAMRITGFTAGSGAADAGLQVGDRITRIGQAYYGNEDFEASVAALSAGESVEVRAVRGDRALEVQVELRAQAQVNAKQNAEQQPAVAPQRVPQRVEGAARSEKEAEQVERDEIVERIVALPEGQARVRILRRVEGEAPAAADGMQELLFELRALRKEMALLRAELAELRAVMAGPGGVRTQGAGAPRKPQRRMARQARRRLRRKS